MASLELQGLEPLPELHWKDLKQEGGRRLVALETAHREVPAQSQGVLERAVVHRFFVTQPQSGIRSVLCVLLYGAPSLLHHLCGVLASQSGDGLPEVLAGQNVALLLLDQRVLHHFIQKDHVREVQGSVPEVRGVNRDQVVLLRVHEVDGVHLQHLVDKVLVLAELVAFAGRGNDSKESKEENQVRSKPHGARGGRRLPEAKLAHAVVAGVQDPLPEAVEKTAVVLHDHE
mmetsp:Transcript_6220/g.18506  ORF Transcript_6220/g.18506 Transcript_6220/m.18506 type:complete len:230 (+) Transcript_6220:1426-2115(+)